MGMIVEKYIIPPVALVDIEEAIRNAKTFTTAALQATIEAVANKQGDNDLHRIAMRLADRLSSKWKSEGKIAKSNTTGRAVWAWKAGAK